MNAMWIIAEREVRGFFSSTLAYVLLVAWLLLRGGEFMIVFAMSTTGFGGGPGESPLTAFFGGTVLFYITILTFVPAITMRFVAEEYRSGNIDSLLSAPITEASVVFGKYLAGLIIWTAMWVPTLFYVFLTSRFGDIDLGATLASYIGVLGLGSHFVALGLLGSTIARTQISAFLIGFMFLAGLFMLGLVAFVANEESTREIWNYISVWEHMTTFGRGIVDSRYLVYDLTMTVIPLFITHRIFVARRLS